MTEEKRQMPRRVYRDLWTDTEKKIFEAMQAVEALGCDTRLTEAITLLGRAKDKVADFVDDEPANDGDENDLSEMPPTG